MENTQTSNKKYAIIAIISVVVLLVLFAAGWFLVKYYKDKSGVAPVSGAQKAKEISGTLLLSMLPNDVTDGIPLTYSIDASSTVITPLYQNLMKDDGLYIFQTSLSPNKKFYVTGGIPTNAIPGKAANSVSLYGGQFRGSFGGIKPDAIVANFGSAPDSKGKTFRNPSVGDHGGILYSVAPEGTVDINFNWEIHYNAVGNDIHVANGLSPKWVSSNQFIYITKKGIRIHDLSTGSDSVIDSITGLTGKPVPIQTNMMINVSRDGKYFAFTNPETAQIHIYGRDGDRYSLKKSFDAFGFWPTFSPDGKVLAVQTVNNLTELKTNPMPKIEFWDIEQDKPVRIDKTIELGAFNNNLLFINDWY